LELVDHRNFQKPASASAAKGGKAQVGEIVAKRDNQLQCFAQLKLDNGDRILISVARGLVKVSKLGWLGLWPVATLWETRTVAETSNAFLRPETARMRPLDGMIATLIDCRSAGAVVVKLQRLGEGQD
jgi:hypothetical protein